MKSGRFVAVLPGFMKLLTPGQSNYKTPMQLEVWSAEPPDDRTDWDHEVDADFDVPEGQICFFAPACSVPWLMCRLAATVCVSQAEASRN